MRTHYCGQLRTDDIDDTVTLCGWVDRRRDHGGVIFLDLRDREGIVQVVFDPDTEEHFQAADRVRSEYVLKISGRVRARSEATINPAMATGQIEVLGKTIEVLNVAATPPFQLDEHTAVGEEVRLRYRYMDLRRPEMQQRLRLRSEVTAAVRQFLHGEGFLDIETPILTRATPEGARDYLVPSRTHAGQFFALPQSPQLFKQLLMVAGFDRYYQIAKCFRDEDLRADRQPEFTQIDIETSFLDETAVMDITERMVRELFKQVLGCGSRRFSPHELRRSHVPLRFRQARSARGSGTGHPRRSDARGGVQGLPGPADDPLGRVAALRVPGGARLSRKEIDDYTRFVGNFGARGLAWIKVNDLAAGTAGLQSPILKFMPDAVIASMMERLAAADGDIVFFGADRARVVNESLGALRLKVAQDLDLLRDGWAPLWVVDFPMFEEDGDSGWTPLHHPFTAPACDTATLRQRPGEALSRAYDMVLNGTELGGGSIRIHDGDMQSGGIPIFWKSPMRKRRGRSLASCSMR